MTNSDVDFSSSCSKPSRTSLRQGSVVPEQVARRLHEPLASGDLRIVVTHDCDCVQSSQVEPDFEMMVGRPISQADGNYTHAKSSRTLHFEYKHRTLGQVFVEVIARPKIVLAKELLHDVPPDSDYQLEDKNKRILSIWLRSRYSRTALPDELVERLRVVKGTLEDVGKANPFVLHGIYLDVDPKIELAPSETYELRIFVVYNTEVPDSESAAEMVVEKLKRRFALKYQTIETPDLGLQWSGIYLSSCEAVSDLEFTLADVLSFQQFQFEYLSLRQTPQATIPEAD